MGIPPPASPITPGDPSANNSGPMGMTFPNPPKPVNPAPVPVAPVGAVAILIAMEDVSESSQRVNPKNPPPAPLWNGREVAPIRRKSRDTESCEIFCICLIIICHLGTLAMAITGSIMYARNKDASGNDSDGQYLKKVATILMVVGWSVFCCGGCAGFFLRPVRNE